LLESGKLREKKILFVCTGNTCRSPFAAAYMRKLCSEKGINNLEILSAGISTIDGLPASQNAIMAAEEFGVDLSSHNSKALTETLLNTAELIICMAESHRNAVLRFSQISPEKVKLLLEFSNKHRKGDIADPFGGNIEIYRNCFLQIASAVDNLLTYILKKKDN